MFVKYATIIFIILAIISNSTAQVIINGNQRIEDETIKSIIADIDLESKNLSQLNIALKKLYESELFVDVDIYQKDSNIIIDLVENPIILDIKFANNKKIDDEILEAEISSKKGDIYSKDKLKSDIKRINDIYIKSGRFLAKINPKIIQKEENRIEIIFDIFEGKKAKIAKINIMGNKNYSDQDLLDEITTKQSRWYKIFGTNDNYDSDRIEFDKEVLRRFYTERGYADFEVISAIAQISTSKDRFFISFLLSEGIKYNFGKIDVINNIRNFDTNLLQEKIDLKEGKIYNAKLVDDVVNKMVELMSDNGYAFGHVSPVLKRDKINNIIDINFVVNQTPKIYINKINISGNGRTKDEVLRRELRIREGDPYNLTHINRSKQRLMNLGFFEEVNFETNRISNDKIDLEITVTERKTGELNFGFGYSTVDRLNGNIGIRENNLFGTGQSLGINSRISTNTSSNEISYSRPWLFGREITGGIDIFNNQIDSFQTISYNQDTKGASFFVNYPILEYINHRVTYSYRVNDVTNEGSNSLAIEELVGNNTISSIGHSLSLDKRDNNMMPSSGYYITLSQTRAGMGGNIDYFKNELVAGYYLPIFRDDVVLKLLGKFGHIDGIGMDVRINDNFYLGGFNFRGFEYAGIGPRVQNDDGSFGDAIGGKSYYVTTAEIRFPTGLPKEMGINTSLFVDAGTVRVVDDDIRNRTNIIDTGSIRASYGLSLAWSSPLGPIRLDFSRISKSEEYDRTESFRFGFGNNF